MTTETKIAAQLDDGHYEIEVCIHEKRLNSTPQRPAAVDEATAIRAFEEHYGESADEPYLEGELELWLAACAGVRGPAYARVQRAVRALQPRPST